jgi:prepilin-type N-terminal cleavage/methylation domain-containing protein
MGDGHVDKSLQDLCKTLVREYVDPTDRWAFNPHARNLAASVWPVTAAHRLKRFLPLRPVRVLHPARRDGPVAKKFLNEKTCLGNDLPLSRMGTSGFGVWTPSSRGGITKHRKRRQAFTLVELLMVIAMIAVQTLIGAYSVAPRPDPFVFAEEGRSSGLR